MSKLVAKSKYFEFLESNGKLPKLDEEGDFLGNDFDQFSDDDLSDIELPPNVEKSNDSSFAQALMKSR